MLRDQPGRDGLHLTTRGPCCHRYLTGVKSHVPPLNALSGERPERTEVLGKADSGHHLA
jgi:hypothetical protein